MLIGYYCYIFFIPMLIISSLLMMISNSWFSMWMIMEINMISFISLIIFDKNIKNELLMNYFLIQTFNSYMFMMSMILMNYSTLNKLLLILMNLSMLTKMGLPPFYLWYLKIMNNLNWMNIFLMSSIQKIIPLLILNNILINKFSMNFNLLLLLILGIYCSIKGLYQINLKIIFSYSSIIQMMWIIMLMNFNEMFMMNYFIMYSIISMNLFFMFSYYNIINLNNIIMIKLNNKINYYFINMSLFSMASMPPFFGFLMKLLIMQILFNNINIITLIMFIMYSLISIFFYLQLLFHNVLINSMSMKLNYKFINYNNNYKYNNMGLSWLMMMMLLMYELM